MRTTLYLLALLALPAFASQTVWKWVDDQGVTHYSDRPVAGAERIELSSGNRAGAQPSYRAPAPASQPQQPVENYSTFEIWKPSEGETIVNTGGRLTVNVRLEPALQPGHDLYLFLNGRLVEGTSPEATSFDLAEVPRGQHQLVAVVQNQRGQRVQQTTPVTFTVRQESIANPPVGPALRPQPKPRPGGSANKLPTAQPSYAHLNGARPAIDPRTNAPPAPAKKPSTPKGG